ncbi:hypothetical protein OA57_11710 [Chelonobacter oris]|uniref:CRISPR-associated protein Csy4 n=1 Tax=Chelonobacter oris TaxID=505317 RepID=A0A0A3AJB8_9PAST|nr:type I-F CRISPR-associated endoribonuclease Cas6/Csy4 [Chelonobacter oris]KGQ69416.1 hypothetical protein OA57_11710 [Chelonobacter oris]
MQYYQEITIIKSPEISPYFIWSKLYTQLHLALVEVLNSDRTSHIGVSFPEYQCIEDECNPVKTLGNKLRVFAHTKQELEALNLSKWLARLTDYVHIRSVQNVPQNVTQHGIVSRLRQKSNNDRITRAYAKRHHLSFEAAKEERIHTFAEKHQLSYEQSLQHYHNPTLKERPFIKIQSLHSKLQYSLEIEQTIVESAVEGGFNSYGLSSKTTVPLW